MDVRGRVFQAGTVRQRLGQARACEVKEGRGGRCGQCRVSTRRGPEEQGARDPRVETQPPLHTTA